jgi:hypothetical protein
VFKKIPLNDYENNYYKYTQYSLLGKLGENDVFGGKI